MKLKLIPYLLVLALAIVLLIVRGFNLHDSGPKNTRGFQRNISLLEYSHHATCRMECRHITSKEVEQVMESGQINYRKSDISNNRCPRYALEGRTSDNQHVRVVFAQCRNKTEVVTVIDLDNEWTCNCPGDDKKYINRN